MSCRKQVESVNAKEPGSVLPWQSRQLAWDKRASCPGGDALEAAAADIAAGHSARRPGFPQKHVVIRGVAKDYSNKMLYAEEFQLGSDEEEDPDASPDINPVVNRRY